MQIINHGIDKKLMDKLKNLINTYYEESLKESFYNSETAKRLGNEGSTSDIDWESSFFIRHHPVPNIKEFTNLPEDLW